MQLPQNSSIPTAATSTTLAAFLSTRYRPRGLERYLAIEKKSHGWINSANKHCCRVPLLNRHPVVEAESMIILAPAIRLERTLNAT